MFFTEQHHQQAMKKLLKEVFRHMSETAAAQPLSTLSDVENIAKAKEWIDSNLDKHIAIAGLAAKAGTNEFKLKKGFKEAYGLGVYGYLLQQRMVVAKQYLQTTSLPLREIARRTGYRNRVNFSAAFKRIHGLTPAQYRRQHQGPGPRPLL